MRSPIHSGARTSGRRTPSLGGWRGVLGLVAALGLAVPAPVVGAAACALGAAGSDCARCAAMQPSKPAPACHGDAAEGAVSARTSQAGSCHQADRAGDCCRFQAHRHAARPEAAGIAAPPSVERPHAMVAVLPPGAAECCGACPVPCESPPGIASPLRTHSSILRL